MKRIFAFALASCLALYAACTNNTQPDTTANAVVSLQPSISVSPTVSATHQSIVVQDNSFVVGAPAIDVLDEPVAYDWLGLQGDMKLLDGSITYDVVYADGEFLLRNNGQLFAIESGNLAAKIERVTGKSIEQWMTFHRINGSTLSKEQNDDLLELLKTLQAPSKELVGDELKSDHTSGVYNDYGMGMSLSIDHTRLFVSWTENGYVDLGSQKAAFEKLLLSTVP